MRIWHDLVLLPVAVALLAACAPGGEPRPGATPAGRAGGVAGPSARGLAFAEAHCSRCHAITSGRFSPDPDAPPFEVVVNAPGLDATTLDSWLRNAHDFPAIMNFEIDPAQVDELAAYMLTLRREDFSPPAQ